MRHIGVDIGGTSIKGIVADGKEIIARAKVPTDIKNGLDGIAESIFKAVDELLPFADDGSGIGIGSAGDIDPFSGRVIYATDNLPGYTGFEISRTVAERFKRRTITVNDAVAAFVGELAFGAAEGCKNAVMLTLGTGLGAGIAVNGKLLLGSKFQGARLGHIPLYPDGRECTCSLSGCAEQYVSATGLIKTAHEFGCICNDCEEIFRRGVNGDSRCKAAVERFIRDFGCVLRSVRCIFDPECIVIGGGLVELRELWLDALLSSLPEDTAALLRPAILGNDAGAVGAQYLLCDDSLLI